MMIQEHKARWPFLAALALVIVTAASGLIYGIGAWPWDVDEVETLQELGLYDSHMASGRNPNSQTARDPQLMPIWYWCQSQVMRFLPVSEGNARLFPALCGILFVVLSFLWAARRHGVGLGLCLALVQAQAAFCVSGSWGSQW
jgi:hypothetical protein